MPQREAAPDRKDPEVRNLLEENARLRARISLLADLGRRVTASLDLPQVLQDVVDAACALTGARYGALGVFEPDGRLRQFTTHGITPEERAAMGRLPQGLGILGFLQQMQEPLRIGDLSKHPRAIGFPPNHPAMKTFLGAPIRLGDEALGNLYLTEKAGGGEFPPEDESLLVLFAAQAALAIRNARLHQESEAERQRLKVLVDTSPVGVMVVEADTHRVLTLNREAERLLGVAFKEGDLLRKYENAAVYRRPDGRALTPEESPISRVLAHGEMVLAQEVRIELPDGRKVPTLVNATPVRASDGRTTAAIVTIQDVSPLEEIERLRSEFVGVVSHELKTPLTAIKGSAATVLGSKRAFDAEETRELFEIINEQADRLRDLVDNLLDMTRIEAGRLSVTTEPTDLRAIIKDAVSVFASGGNSHEVQLTFPEGTPLAKADKRRITQVVSNLLSNAAKFSPADKSIRVQVERSDPLLTVRVKDQGRGIPPDKLPHLFKKFSQVHDDSGAKLMGTGLGLAISKGIVEAHGGRIWAESDGVGKGATFTFTVPIAHEAPAPVPTTSPDPSRRSEHLGKVHRSGEKTWVLAVDDEPQVLRYLQRALTEAGYHPITTHDSAKVVSLVETEEPDLVLLDVRLPGVNGFDLLRRIREFSGVPVIFLTAGGETDEVVKALRMGADDYITKPFSPSELLARIEAALRRRVMSDTIEVRPPVTVEDLSINFAERRVTRGQEVIALSATEYKLLYELATHAGMVLTHGQILQRVWGPEYGGETELVRSVIRNLRRKLGDDARNPRFIFTESQVGYRMAKPAGG